MINQEAERTLLAALLVNNDLVPTCSLAGVHFGFPNHRMIYEAIQALYPGPTNLVTLTHQLHEGGVLEAAGGAEYVSSLTDGVPRMSSVAHYEAIIREEAVRRGLLRVAEDLRVAAMDATVPVDATISRGETYLRRLSGAGGRAFITGAELRRMEDADQQRRAQRGDSYARFGLPRLDHYSRPGLQEGSTWVVGARTNIGKSAFLCQVAVNNVIRGRKVLLYACEMGYVRVGWRIFGGMSQVSISKIREPLKMDQFEANAYLLAMDRIGEAENFCIAFNPKPTVVQIAAAVRSARAHMGGVDLVVVDYFQKIRPAKARKGMFEERTEVAQDVVALASTEKVPFLVGCQLNREAETDEEKDRPRKSELKGTGALEEEATGVILLHRWGVHKADPSQQGAEIIIAKHQDGVTGTLSADFQGEIAQWGCEFDRRGG